MRWFNHRWIVIVALIVCVAIALLIPVYSSSSSERHRAKDTTPAMSRPSPSPMPSDAARLEVQIKHPFDLGWDSLAGSEADNELTFSQSLERQCSIVELRCNEKRGKELNVPFMFDSRFAAGEQTFALLPREQRR